METIQALQRSVSRNQENRYGTIQGKIRNFGRNRNIEGTNNVCGAAVKINLEIDASLVILLQRASFNFL